MPAGRVLFAKLVVADLDAMSAFYARAFGFAESRRIDAGEAEEALLALPGDGFTLVLFHYRDGRALTVGNAHGPLAITTRDIDASWAEALAAGAKPEREPIDLPRMRVAFLADPEGHPLELIQYTEQGKAA